MKNKFTTLDTHCADGKVEGNNLIVLALVFGTQVCMHRYIYTKNLTIKFIEMKRILADLDLCVSKEWFYH